MRSPAAAWMPAHDGDDLAARLLDRNRMLAAAADDSYQRLLKDALLPRIAARLEERLRQSAGEPAARTYETLRAYLMLFGGKHFDAAALRAYFANDWQLDAARKRERGRARGAAAPPRPVAGRRRGRCAVACRCRAGCRHACARARRAAGTTRRHAPAASKTATRRASPSTPGRCWCAPAARALADLPPPRAATRPRARARSRCWPSWRKSRAGCSAHRARWPRAPGLADEVERLVVTRQRALLAIAARRSAPGADAAARRQRAAGARAGASRLAAAGAAAHGRARNRGRPVRAPGSRRCARRSMARRRRSRARRRCSASCAAHLAAADEAAATQGAAAGRATSCASWRRPRATHRRR